MRFIFLLMLSVNVLNCQELPGSINTPDAGATAVDGAIFGSLFTPNQIEVWKVVIFAGQSNQVSAAASSNFPATYDEGFAPTQLRWNNTAMQWDELGRNNMNNAALEVAKLAGIDNVSLRYIHVAQSGTGLSLTWNPNTPGSLWNQLLAQIQNVKDDADANNAVIQWVFLDWMQGERDSRDLTHANNYESLMYDFISGIQAVTSNNIKISQGKPYSFLPTASGYLYTNTVRTAKDNIAASSPNYFAYDCDAFAQSGDNIHQSAVGQLQRGAFLYSLLNPFFN